MKRLLDILAYSIAGLALAGGLVYGWLQLTRPPELPPVPPLAAVQPAVPPPPAEAPPPAVPAVPAAPAPTETTHQASPDAAARVVAQDQARFLSLQQDCYSAAANNQNGEYPTLQAMACDRYAQFALAHGWDPGTMPAYGQPAPKPPPEAAAQQPVIQDQSQAILLAPGYYSHNPDSGYRHRWPQQPETPARPQQQIGPNFTPPPPQQPPPVSQRQRPTSKMVPAGPQK